MTSPDPLVEQVGGASRLRTLVTRLHALVKGPSLDSELAMGVRPSASAILLARADLITRPRTRRRIRAALNRAVKAADLSARRVTAEAPLSVEAIRACRDELTRLAEAVVATENPRVQGVAIAHELAYDGTGALFFQPNKKQDIERLASTIWAAQRALSVSSEFDHRSGLRRETPA